MKQSPNRRSRSRNNGKRPGGRNNFESNGPDVKVRGTAQQVLEKYLALGRDAASSGDRIAAESYFQHAEHYYRIANADNNTNPQQNRRERPGNQQGPITDIEISTSQKIDDAAPAASKTDVQSDDAPAAGGSQPAPAESADESASSVDLADQPQPDTPPPRKRRARAKPAPAEGAGERELA